MLYINRNLQKIIYSLLLLILILNAQKKDQKEIYRITVDFFLLSFTKNRADTLWAGCAEKRVAGRYKCSSFSGDWKT